MLSVLLAVTSCASNPGDRELLLPPETIWQLGYSITPLNEQGWFVRARDRQHLMIGKYGEYPDQTFAIDGLLVRLPRFRTTEELTTFLKERQTTFPDTQRFTMLKYEIDAYPKKGPNCVKSHSVMIDHAANNRSGKRGDMDLEAYFLVCIHPEDKSIGVQLMYSQRHWPGQGDPQFSEKATTVLDSIELTDPKPTT
jgi:hypothetical protein